MSMSLVAVFIPILLMGGIVGRLFREFAVTLAVAICVSLVVSLTTTPMMCAQVPEAAKVDASMDCFTGSASESSRTAVFVQGDARTVLRHPQVTLMLTI